MLALSWLVQTNIGAHRYGARMLLFFRKGTKGFAKTIGLYTLNETLELME